MSSKIQEGSTVLEFVDNGRGIDLNSYGKKLFGLFQRFHLDVEGKGIGLHIAKTILERYKGELKVYSRPGEGATFSLVFNGGPGNHT